MRPDHLRRMPPAHHQRGAVPPVLARGTGGANAVADDGALSPTGRFTTAPRDDERVAVRFAFSGDAHGAWRRAGGFPALRDMFAAQGNYTLLDNHELGFKQFTSTWQLYFAQRWGANSIFIIVDDRSYRDIELKKAGGGGDTSVSRVRPVCRTRRTNRFAAPIPLNCRVCDWTGLMCQILGRVFPPLSRPPAAPLCLHGAPAALPFDSSPSR